MKSVGQTCHRICPFNALLPVSFADGYAPFLSMQTRDTFLNPESSVISAPGPGHYDPVLPRENIKVRLSHPDPDDHPFRDRHPHKNQRTGNVPVNAKDAITPLFTFSFPSAHFLFALKNLATKMDTPQKRDWLELRKKKVVKAIVNQCMSLQEWTLLRKDHSERKWPFLTNSLEVRKLTLSGEDQSSLPRKSPEMNDQQHSHHCSSQGGSCLSNKAKRFTGYSVDLGIPGPGTYSVRKYDWIQDSDRQGVSSAPPAMEDNKSNRTAHVSFAMYRCSGRETPKFVAQIGRAHV